MKTNHGEFKDLTLLVPEKSDVERDAVAAAWQAGGGIVIRLDRFWEPPELESKHTRLYGNHTFSLVLAEQLALELVSPADDWLVHVPRQWLKRSVKLRRLSDMPGESFPAFVKPVIPKTFRAAVYEQFQELADECRGLPPDAELIVSEIAAFSAEARTFILDGQVITSAVYEGHANAADAAAFVQSLAGMLSLPRVCVVDAGYIDGEGWAILEANSVWSAGLNGCDPYAAARCIACATQAR